MMKTLKELEVDCHTLKELKQTAREWVEELSETLRKSAKQGYSTKIIDNYAAQISWIKHFFNLGDEK